MTSSLMRQAQEFRATYDQVMLSGFTRFGFLRLKLFNMQLNLIEEEFREVMDAADHLTLDPKDTKIRTNFLKELADLVFVIYQMAATYDLDLDEAMKRIYESNLSKLGEDGKPIFRSDGKVMKGPNYKPPVLDDLIPN